MSARVGVVLFPGSNCEQDALEAFAGLGAEAEVLWHGDATVNGVDAVNIAGVTDVWAESGRPTVAGDKPS